MSDGLRKTSTWNLCVCEYVKPIKMKLILAAVAAVVVLGVAQGDEECFDELSWCKTYGSLCDDADKGFREYIRGK